MSERTTSTFAQAVRRTPFHGVHAGLGARMVEFAGFEMPIQFTSIIEEHKRVREHAGVFDVSHMGEIEVWGSDAREFVQRITINDAGRLEEGAVQYSAMCYDDGGIVDDLLVYHLGDHYMLVVNASNIAKDHAWMRDHLEGDVKLKDRSDEIALLAVQGPQSPEILQKLTSADLAAIPFYHFVRQKLAGVDMIISRTGYTGESGFELYFPAEEAMAEKVWHAVMHAGKEAGIGPAGLGARDTLRLEMGFCLYGNDIDHTTNPLEAGLGWLTKLDKGPFIGREALLKVKEHGLKRRLVGFTLEDKAFPRHGYEIRSDGSGIGTVTSGTFSPILDKAIGMGYVGIDHAKAGTGIQVSIRNRDHRASVVPLPFLKKR